MVGYKREMRERVAQRHLHCCFGTWRFELRQGQCHSATLQTRLLQLGVSDFIERAQGDDQHTCGHFRALKMWLEELWTLVLQLHRCWKECQLTAG